NCQNFKDKFYKSAIDVQTTFSTITLLITIMNVSKSEDTGLENKWSILYNETVEDSCKLQVVQRPEYLCCQYKVSINFLNVSCWTSQMSIWKTCTANIKLFKDSHWDANNTQMAVNTTIEKIYYTSECSFELTINESTS
ncbi:unnamed protein product, partial [Lymnaea stagnalis]